MKSPPSSVPGGHERGLPCSGRSLTTTRCPMAVTKGGQGLSDHRNDRVAGSSARNAAACPVLAPVNQLPSDLVQNLPTGGPSASTSSTSAIEKLVDGAYDAGTDGRSSRPRQGLPALDYNDWRELDDSFRSLGAMPLARSNQRRTSEARNLERSGRQRQNVSTRASSSAVGYGTVSLSIASTYRRPLNAGEVTPQSLAHVTEAVSAASKSSSVSMSDDDLARHGRICVGRDDSQGNRRWPLRALGYRSGLARAMTSEQEEVQVDHCRFGPVSPARCH